MAAQLSKLRISVNLLYPQGVPQHLAVKLLKWLVSYGRYIAIVVEAIVVATFLIRFKYDDDLSNLQTKIAEQVPYIKSLSPDEAQIRKVQFKLATVKSFYQNNPDWQKFFTTFSNLIPSYGVKLSSLSMEHTAKSPIIQFRFSGTASSINDLAILISGLKQEKTFRDIALTNLSFDQSQVTFSLSGATK